jgi:flagellar biosynthesis/type III secretory pathway chaperone
MGVNNLLDLICQELELYRRLLAEQQEKIQLYLQGDLDLVTSSVESDKRILKELRAINQRLETELDGRDLSEIAAEMDSSESERLRAKIVELRKLTGELSRMNLQNHRYVQSSFGFTRAMLGEIFSDNVNYTQNGYLRSGQTVVEF